MHEQLQGADDSASSPSVCYEKTKMIYGPLLISISLIIHVPDPPALSSTTPNLCAHNIFMKTKSVSFAASQPTSNKYKKESTLQCGKYDIKNMCVSKGSPRNSCVRE